MTSNNRSGDRNPILPGIANLWANRKPFSYSMLAQAVSSLTNFGFTLYLVRALPKEAYGFYAATYTVVLFVTASVTATLSSQYVVNRPGKSVAARLSYAVNSFLATSLITTLLSAIIIILTVLIPSLSLSIVVAAVAAMGASSLRELVIRIAYCERQESVPLLGSLAIAFGISSFLVALHYHAHEATIAQAFSAYAVGQISGTLVCLILLRLPWAAASRNDVFDFIRESWSGGRWNLLTTIVSTARTQAHNIIVAPSLGLIALAEINAARVFIVPAIMAVPPLSQIAIPRLAELRTHDVAGLQKRTHHLVGLLASISIIYSLGILFLYPFLSTMVLGSEYGNLMALVVGWCLVAIMNSIRNGFLMGAEAMRLFRPLALLSFVSAIIALSAVWFLTLFLGAKGSLIGTALGEISLATFLVILLRKHAKPNQQESPKHLENTV